MRYFTSKKERFNTWWYSPVTRADRITSAICGAWAFLIIGLVAGFALAPAHTLSLIGIGYLAIGSLVSGVVLGALFPKVIRCIAFPFVFIGIGGSS